MQAKEYPEALRKINNILEASPLLGDLIEKKIILLCYTGDVERAQSFLNENKSILGKISPEEIHSLQGEIYFH